MMQSRLVYPDESEQLVEWEPFHRSEAAFRATLFLITVLERGFSQCLHFDFYVVFQNNCFNLFVGFPSLQQCPNVLFLLGLSL